MNASAQKGHSTQSSSSCHGVWKVPKWQWPVKKRAASVMSHVLSKPVVFSNCHSAPTLGRTSWRAAPCVDVLHRRCHSSRSARSIPPKTMARRVGRGVESVWPQTERWKKTRPSSDAIACRSGIGSPVAIKASRSRRHMYRSRRQRWAHLERERIWNGFGTGTGTAKNPFPFLPLALGPGQERIAERPNNGHRTVPPRSGAPTNHGKSVPAVPTRSYTVIFPFLFRS